jgi:hypothetical protein
VVTLYSAFSRQRCRLADFYRTLREERPTFPSESERSQETRCVMNVRRGIVFFFFFPDWELRTKLWDLPPTQSPLLLDTSHLLMIDYGLREQMGSKSMTDTKSCGLGKMERKLGKQTMCVVADKEETTKRMLTLKCVCVCVCVCVCAAALRSVCLYSQFDRVQDTYVESPCHN